MAPAETGQPEVHRDRRSALHQPVGPRFPSGIPSARPAARGLSRRVVPRLYGDGHRAGAARHRHRAAAPGAARARRIVRPAEPRVPRDPPRASPHAADQHPGSARRRIGDCLLLVAQGSGSAGRVAEGRGAQRGAVPRRVVGRGPQPQPGDVPRRTRRHRRRHGRVRDGYRSVERAVRRARRGAAVAGALSAGVGPRGPGRPAGRVRPDLLGRRLRPLAADARGQRRVERERANPAA